MFKTKYVFVIEADSYAPINMERCYVFDNLDDAKSFYEEQGYTIDLYADNAMFVISNKVKINWHGDIFKGVYV